MSAPDPTPDPSSPTTYDAPPPSGPQRSLFVKIVAVVLVLVLLLGGLLTALATTGVLQVFGPDEHDLTLVDEAGGMQRDPELEQQLAAQLQAAEESFVQVLGNGAGEGERALDYSRVGAYQQADESVGPVGAIVVLGAKAATEQDPDAYIDDVIANAQGNGLEAERVDAGDDAVGACVAQDADQGLTICAWATHDTVGQLVPTVQGWTPDQLAALMLRVRADVETTE